MNRDYDFEINSQLKCLEYDDQKVWDFECNFYAVSSTAIAKNGSGILGHIVFDYEPSIISSLQNIYPNKIPSSTVVLSLITRNTDNPDLKGVGMSMVCSLLAYLKNFKHITHIIISNCEGHY